MGEYFELKTCLEMATKRDDVVAKNVSGFVSLVCSFVCKASINSVTSNMLQPY